MWDLFHTISVGPEQNSIQNILRDVDWNILAYQLDLKNQVKAIDAACSVKDQDPLTCRMREVLSRFIQTQPPETCNKTIEKIAVALEKIGNRYVKETFELRGMTGEMCVFEDFRRHGMYQNICFLYSYNGNI